MKIKELQLLLENLIRERELRRKFRNRTTGKILKVITVPSNGDYTLGIKVSGRWLEKFYNLGDYVLLRVDNFGKITIEPFNENLNAGFKPEEEK